MSTRSKMKKISEEEIDKIVVSQTDDNSAWEKPIHVHRTNPVSLPVPAELVAHTAFLALLHRRKRVLRDGLCLIIKERLKRIF